MHIAMLVFNQPFKGTYWRAYYIGRELCRRGHTVTLLATAPHERWGFRVTYEEQGRLALVEAPDMLHGSMRSGWDAWASMARIAWLQLTRFDLIHAFECRPSVIMPALATRRRSGVPLVIDWCDWFGRGGSVEERRNSLRKTLLRPTETFFEEHFRTYADATTVINTVLGEKALALGVDPATITLLPNGSDTAGWPLEDRQAARAALDLPADAPLIGYVGAIFERDAHLMAQAFDHVVAHMPTARLLVLGYCNIAIEQLVTHPEAVIRTGPIDTATLRRYLCACNVGWAPLCDTGANRGRWPLKLNTYMEAALPFITTRVGDLGMFVEQYHAGTAAAPRPDDVAAHALHLLSDPTHAAALGAEGRRLSENELNWARVANVAEGLYRQLLN